MYFYYNFVINSSSLLPLIWNTFFVTLFITGSIWLCWYLDIKVLPKLAGYLDPQSFIFIKENIIAAAKANVDPRIRWWSFPPGLKEFALTFVVACAPCYILLLSPLSPTLESKYSSLVVVLFIYLGLMIPGVYLFTKSFNIMPFYFQYLMRRLSACIIVFFNVVTVLVSTHAFDITGIRYNLYRGLWLSFALVPSALVLIYVAVLETSQVLFFTRRASSIEVGLEGAPRNHHMNLLLMVEYANITVLGVLFIEMYTGTSFSSNASSHLSHLLVLLKAAFKMLLFVTVTIFLRNFNQTYQYKDVMICYWRYLVPASIALLIVNALFVRFQ